MHILWNISNKGAFTHDILSHYEDPKPAYTTLATFLKILEKKGFLKSTKVGATLFYSPRVSEMEYCERVMSKALDDYFDGDQAQFIQFIAGLRPMTDEQKKQVCESL